jgi:hypothetical protein
MPTSLLLLEVAGEVVEVEAVEVRGVIVPRMEQREAVDQQSRK